LIYGSHRSDLLSGLAMAIELTDGVRALEIGRERKIASIVAIGFALGAEGYGFIMAVTRAMMEEDVCAVL
jgi:hypothetical protein